MLTGKTNFKREVHKRVDMGTRVFYLGDNMSFSADSNYSMDIIFMHVILERSFVGRGRAG